MSGSMGRGFDLKDAEKAWNILEHAIHEIYNYDARGLDFKEVYRAAYNMVLHGFEEKLYSGVVSAMTSHQKEIAKSIEAAQGAMFLEELNRSWEEYDMALGMIRFILIKFTHKTQIHDLGLNLWRDNIIHSSIIQTRLRDTLLELVQCERTGDVINRGLTRNITKMLMYLGPSVYEEIFEMPFLDVSSDFYRVESQQVIEHCDCGDYLKKAEERLNEEIERVSHYLNVRSEAKITRVLEKEMIETHMHRLVHMENSGLVSMIMDEKFEDLGRMYNLLSRVPSGLTIMKDVMTSHIREIGEDLVTDPERLKDPVNFVHELLDKKDRLRDTLLELVQCERIGGVINRGLMRNITKMLMDLGPSVYEEIFEKPFLDVSSDFYREESQQVIEHCDCGDYLKKAEERLDEEIKRVSLYLDVRSEAKITRVVEEEMIESHMHRLVHMENSGLVSMIMDEKFEDLGRMYNLLLRVPSGLTIMKDVMTSHIRETGRDLFTDPERLKDPINFVQELLDKKDGLDKIINLAFNDDKDFQNALSSSFEYFINLNPRSPEFISLFVDDKLRNGLKKDKEEEIELVLDKVTMLLRYLEEKDVFEKYYQQHLAKRLLSGKTSSDAERNFIMKLKTECAYQFTSKLEGM